MCFAAKHFSKLFQWGQPRSSKMHSSKIQSLTLSFSTTTTASQTHHNIIKIPYYYMPYRKVCYKTNYLFTKFSKMTKRVCPSKRLFIILYGIMINQEHFLHEPKDNVPNSMLSSQKCNREFFLC